VAATVAAAAGATDPGTGKQQSPVETPGSFASGVCVPRFRENNPVAPSDFRQICAAQSLPGSRAFP
jgi:hypothetical protein